MPRRHPGGTTAAGYGTDHAKLRRAWATEVAAGRATCHATHCLHVSRGIAAGEPWDLGHTPDRTTWTGPEHRDCNRADGARRGNHHRARHRSVTPSRDW